VTLGGVVIDRPIKRAQLGVMGAQGVLDALG